MLTHAALQSRRWGGLDFLRDVLENEDLPSDHRISSVHPGEFDWIMGVLAVSDLAIAHKQKVLRCVDRTLPPHAEEACGPGHRGNGKHPALDELDMISRALETLVGIARERAYQLEELRAEVHRVAAENCH